MISRIEFVRFGFVAYIDREKVEVFDKEIRLLRNGLRAHGVGQMPSVRAKSVCDRSHRLESGVAYETFRVPVSVIRMFFTLMDSGLFRTSFPRSSVSCDSEDSP
jgi:hypothetical protein